MRKIVNFRESCFLAISLFLSFYFQRPSLDIGFHLKPFMMMTFFVGVLLFFRRRVVIRFDDFDIAFLLFCFYGLGTIVYSVDHISTVRIFFGAMVVFLSYMVVKSYFLSSRFTINQVENLFYFSSALFVFISFFMYLVGYVIINGDYSSYEHVRFYGVLVERGMPRLIGPLIDPNIFVMYTSLFFFFLFFKKNKSLMDHFMVILVAVSIALTLSRGGILSVVLPILLYYLFLIVRFFIGFRVKIPKWRSLFLYGLISFSLFWFIVSYGNFYSFIERRVASVADGSGRFEIWGNLFSLWLDNPIFGIGWYNFLHYNIELFGRYNYAHNTFLEVLVETGLVGFLIYISFHVFLFLKIVNVVRFDPRYKYLFFYYISLIVSLNSLSLVINEFLFLFLGFVSVFSFRIKRENS